MYSGAQKENLTAKAPSKKLSDLLRENTSISIIELVELCLEEACTVHASDIHLDPTETSIVVRFRIDGVLHSKHYIPKQILPEIISRIKILAHLRTDEHNAAQDGRFRFETKENNRIDIRVSITPTYHGENAVLRLLTNNATKHTFDNLGLRTADKEKIRQAIRRPHGMILATGPTGSGKTTTLYTLIKELNQPEISIITIEEPIEYAIPGITQIQINQRTQLTFAGGLRSILRQDPDIIMVGEIRDSETASIAVNTALTGHLLLSTLHTNDSATTLPRLLDMGVDAYLVASTVECVIAQRLVRKICSKCKETYELTEVEQQHLNTLLPTRMEKYSTAKTFYRGKGCTVCDESGYAGRLGMYEVLIVSPTMKEAILRKDSATVLKNIAISEGMTTMFEDGLEKAQAGETTLTEVLRIAHE